MTRWQYGFLKTTVARNGFPSVVVWSIAGQSEETVARNEMLDTQDFFKAHWDLLERRDSFIGELGEDCWEMFGVTDDTMFFKRPLNEHLQ